MGASTGGRTESGTNRAVVALGVAAVVSWALSYSWLIGVVVPMPAFEYEVSPWLVVEIAAVVLGVAAVVVALVAAGRGGTSRRARVWAWIGGAAALLAGVSLAWAA
ncbi:hypothetical protein [Desertivibrio insolitus]|uniref:hypothetical protein n=1 Tax=Herbiconiux sp. SYSU D00978 TaxID=2812562 RepID=UPI001A959126|nr:hypothetical protein [Herbiconiux sp. SYSU D00978]